MVSFFDMPWPEVTSTGGFFLYSFLTYLIVLFFGWLLNPSVDAAIQEGTKKESQFKKGAAMRE